LRSIDWPAIDILAEIHGCSQPEILIAELLSIRNFMESLNG
jgi:hypothetical protein